MRVWVYVTLVLLISCEKEPVRMAATPVVPCGCEYSLFNGNIPESAGERQFSPYYSSVNELTEAYLEYLNNNDKDGLKSLLVTEVEFSNWIFPEYNIANPLCDIEWQMIFNSLQNKSQEGIDIMKYDMMDTTYQLKTVEFTNHAQEEDFETYEIFNRTLIHTKTANGEETIAVVGSVVELNGSYKFLSYRENNIF
jgi:hypothetical protein